MFKKEIAMDLNNFLSLFSNFSQNSSQPQPQNQNLGQQIALYPQDFSNDISSQNTNNGQQSQFAQQNNQNNLQQNFSNLLPFLAMLFGKEKANFGQLFSNLPALNQFKPFLQLFSSKKEEQKKSSPPISSYKKIEEQNE